MKMVKSCLTVYMMTISSAILLGTFNAATDPVAMGQQHSESPAKIHFHSHVKTNASLNIPDKNSTGQQHYQSPPNPKILQTSPHVPSDLPYFALFDPVANITLKLDLSQPNPPPNIDHLTPKHPRRDKIKNFIEWDTMRDSEKEVRIHYNGITAKETVVKTGMDEDTGKRLGLKLRQLTDGKHFIQLIYNFDNEIQDCEYIAQKSAIVKFLRTFRNDVEHAKSVYEETEEAFEEKSSEIKLEEEEEDEDYWENDEGMIEKYPRDSEYDREDDFSQEYRNVTFRIIHRDEDLPGELAEWMNYRKLRQKCRESHRILKQLTFNRRHGDEVAKKLAEEHIERVKRSLDFSLIFPGTKWCGKSNVAEKYTALGGFSKTDKCCRTHDHCHPLVPAFEEKYGYYNFRPYTVSHCRCDLRRKRDIMNALLVPGTKWCGKGRQATKYTSLGGFSSTDKCCRAHDTMCPHWIGGLEEKYGLFNWRINTLMHCRCDKRFRACLKMAKTGMANFVGKLFFNVVQTKCFVLKPREVCLEYSWWGKCKKMGYRKKAYLKDNLLY